MCNSRRSHHLAFGGVLFLRIDGKLLACGAKTLFFTVWRLLHDPSLKIGEIGEMVGCADTAHFARVFKKIVGMSANEYRNSL